MNDLIQKIVLEPKLGIKFKYQCINNSTDLKTEKLTQN